MRDSPAVRAGSASVSRARRTRPVDGLRRRRQHRGSPPEPPSPQRPPSPAAPPPRRASPPRPSTAALVAPDRGGAVAFGAGQAAGRPALQPPVTTTLWRQPGSQPQRAPRRSRAHPNGRRPTPGRRPARAPAGRPRDGALAQRGRGYRRWAIGS